MQAKKRKVNTFTLQSVVPKHVDEIYGLSTIEKKPSESNEITKIDDLTVQVSYYPFIEERYENTCVVGMKISEDSHCFWCHHSFDSIPIGCPLSYHPIQVVREYHSHVTKENYQVEQAISKKQFNNSMTIRNKGFYKTDGIFCSFNCCMAWIENKQLSSSKFLLNKMYFDIFGDAPVRIEPSGDWRLLRVYGGYMSIEEYRNSFNKYIFIDKTNTFENFPKVYPIGSIFEKQHIF